MMRLVSMVSLLAAVVVAASSLASRINVLVTMQEGTAAPLRIIKGHRHANRATKLNHVRERLETHAKMSQKPVLDVLERANKTSHRRAQTFWITNQVYVQDATPELIECLKQTPGVLDVAPEEVYSIVTPVLETNSSTRLLQTASSPAPSWGLSRINAPRVWASGNTGTNVVVGLIDTGVRGTHEALAGNYRAPFGWYDPERQTMNPYDISGHGTHVAGIAVGANGIGVAYGAKWIACKGCRATGCQSSDLLACLQFMLCPTTPDGLMKDCSKAPHVVNNSWGGGTRGSTTFYTAIEALKTAGIIPVFSNGNAGPACTSGLAPGDYAGVISVGATDSIDALSLFSAKGPTVNGVVKPDLVAPGAQIRSSCYGSDTQYCTMSGTSMAAPHVSGSIALLLSARPGLTYDQVKQQLQTRAVKTGLAPSGYTCGATPDTVFPNNQYGAGRLDAAAIVA